MSDDPENIQAGNDLSGDEAAKLMRAALPDSDPLDTNTSAGHWDPPQPEALASLMPGYDITRILGRGGMGAVYHGIQKNLDREVAIKLLPPELGQNPEFEARFEREAKSMAKLSHPNIVQIFDFGHTSAGHHYIVMEYVDGSDLHQLIRSGELEPEGALNAISQICDALEYAHSEGFVHRDIKPANMFINSKGVLKVGDFGLAKLVENESALSAAEQMGLTMTGVAMGTPHYIAPEQLEEGNHVDQRADIYSLGIMFYQMLTGEIPRGTVKAPSEKGKTLDVRIDGVVFKAMESDPGARYQSATDLRTDVDVIRTTPHDSGPISSPAESLEPPASSATKKKPRNPLTLAAMIILPLLLVGGIIFALLRAEEQSNSATASPQGDPPSSADSPQYSLTPENRGETARSGNPGDRSSPDSPPEKKAGSLHGLVYDKNLQQIVPLWIPSGWKNKRFTSVGAKKANGESPRTSFNWWAIVEDGALLSQYDGRPMGGIAKQAGNLLNFDHHVGVTLQGTLIAGPDFYPPPAGSNFIDAKAGKGFALALTSQGDVHYWPGRTLKEKLFQPPAEVLMNARAISASTPTAIVLSRSGGVTQWHSERGIIQKEMTVGKDVVAISAQVSVSSDGKVHSIGYSDLELTGRVVDLDYGHEILALKFEAGDWRIFPRTGSKSESSDALIAAFESTQKRPIIDLFVDATGGHAIAIWLEEAADSNTGHPSQAVFLPAEAGTSTSPLIQSASLTNPFINSLGMQFVPVPIIEGATDGQKILFSTWETRVADYRTFLKSDPQREWFETEFPQEDDHPAVRVPWHDATAFCDWLTEQDRKSGRLQANETYRLPTDHEWSCAAGIGHLEDPSATPEAKECRLPNLFPWGNTLPPPTGIENYYGKETEKNPVRISKGSGFRNPLDQYEDPFDRTAPVGSFVPNDYGLHDMGGNAFEWCSDWYSDQKNKRTLRGASWGASLGHVLLTSSRVANDPNIRFDSHGFRCVIALENE